MGVLVSLLAKWDDFPDYNNDSDSPDDEDEDEPVRRAAFAVFLRELWRQTGYFMRLIFELYYQSLLPSFPPSYSTIMRSARSLYRYLRRQRKREYKVNIAKRKKARRRRMKAPYFTGGWYPIPRVPEKVWERSRRGSRAYYTDKNEPNDEWEDDAKGGQENIVRDDPPPYSAIDANKSVSGSETERAEGGRTSSRRPFVRELPPHMTIVRRRGNAMSSGVAYPRPQHYRDILRFSPGAGNDRRNYFDRRADDDSGGQRSTQTNRGHGHQNRAANVGYGHGLGGHGDNDITNGGSMYGDFYDTPDVTLIRGLLGLGSARINGPGASVNDCNNVDGRPIPNDRVTARGDDMFCNGSVADTDTAEALGGPLLEAAIQELKDEGPHTGGDDPAVCPSPSDTDLFQWSKSPTETPKTDPRPIKKPIKSGRDFGPAQRVSGGRARHLKPKIDEKRVKALGDWYDQWMEGRAARKKQLVDDADCGKVDKKPNGDLNKETDVIPALPTEVMQVVVRFADYASVLALRASNSALRDLIDKELRGTDLLVTRSYSDNPYVARLLVPGHPEWGATPFLSPYTSPAQQRSALSRVKRVEIKKLPPSGELNTLLGYLPPTALVKVHHAELRLGCGGPAWVPFHCLPTVSLISVLYDPHCACTDGAHFRAGVSWLHTSVLAITLSRWAFDARTCRMVSDLAQSSHDVLEIRLDMEKEMAEQNEFRKGVKTHEGWGREKHIKVLMGVGMWWAVAEVRAWVASVLKVKVERVHAENEDAGRRSWSTPGVGVGAM